MPSYSFPVVKFAATSCLGQCLMSKSSSTCSFMQGIILFLDVYKSKKHGVQMWLDIVYINVQSEKRKYAKLHKKSRSLGHQPIKLP